MGLSGYIVRQRETGLGNVKKEKEAKITQYPLPLRADSLMISLITTFTAVGTEALLSH